MLKKRLHTAASLVRGGDILCDVGSDHAYLPLMLIESGVIKRAIACDVNPGPLAHGREHALKRGIDTIDFILSDGLTAVGQDFDVATICGMGGELIIKIITEGGAMAQKRLILQPMTGIEKLRAFLWQNGYNITDELFAVEDKKPYCIIAANYDGERRNFTYTELYLGKIRPNTPEFTAWAVKIRRSAEKRLRGADTNEAENINVLIKECRHYEA